MCHSRLLLRAKRDHWKCGVREATTPSAAAREVRGPRGTDVRRSGREVKPMLRQWLVETRVSQLQLIVRKI